MLQQYQEAIENSNTVSKTDVNGIITFVNDEFCKISGYSKEELLGKNHNIVRHSDVPASKFKLLWQTIKAKKIYKSTVKNRAKNGSAFYVNTTVIPILNKKGEIEEFIAIRYDVTQEIFYKHSLEKKERELEVLNADLEKRVEAKTKELKELNETLEMCIQEEIKKNEEKQKVMFWQSRFASLGEMLANIAHQWRQPLAELSLTLFSLKKAAFNQDIDEAGMLYNESKALIKNMSNTIEDFSNFFKPGKEKQHFMLRESTEEALHILKRVLKKDMIQVKTSYEDVSVLGITNEFTQVIINLLKNSRDAFMENRVPMREIELYNAYTYNKTKKTLYKKNRYIPLNKKERQFLELLLEYYEKEIYVVSDAIIKKSLRADEVSDDRLRTFIRRFRAKTSKELIKNIKSEGYQIVIA